MPPKRRASDRGWVRIVGWVACTTLAVSLTWTFIRALFFDASGIDPLFFFMQTVASSLFLVYSIRLKNRIFIAANGVAVFNAVGTLLVALLR